jgi:arginase
MQVQVITVPYDSAQPGKRMGAGLDAFLQHGRVAHLQQRGYDVAAQQVAVESAFPAEIATSFELYRLLSSRVQQARSARQFPLVLSGNCSSALGTVAGCAPQALGVVWFDAHGDFNTPDTTWSGFLDGMGLATLTGRCWQTLAARIPGFRPIPDSAIVHIGGHDFGEQEQRLFAESQITRVPPDVVQSNALRTLLHPVLQRLQAECPSIYLHLDLDVLDPTEAIANEYAAPNGLSIPHMLGIIEMIGEFVTIEACGVASYDPAYDRDHATLQAGFQLIERVLAAAQAAAKETAVKSAQARRGRTGA